MTYARATYPTRRLTDASRPAPYTPAVSTNVGRTIRKARLLQRLQTARLERPAQPEIPNLRPPMALPVEVLMHLPRRGARSGGGDA